MSDRQNVKGRNDRRAIRKALGILYTPLEATEEDRLALVDKGLLEEEDFDNKDAVAAAYSAAARAQPVPVDDGGPKYIIGLHMELVARLAYALGEDREKLSDAEAEAFVNAAVEELADRALDWLARDVKRGLRRLR